MAEQKFTIDGASVTVIAYPLHKIYIDAINYLLKNHTQNYKNIYVQIENRKPYSLCYAPCIMGKFVIESYRGFEPTVYIKAVTGQKDDKVPLAKIMHTYFHEYGHLLQYSKGIVKSMSYKEAEDDADKFADTYLPVFLGEYGYAV